MCEIPNHWAFGPFRHDHGRIRAVKRDVRSSVCLVGNFPPAPSGQAWVNESYRTLLASSGARVSVIDISPRAGRLTLARRLSRLPRAAIGIVRLTYLLLRGRAKSVYVGVAGGY